MTPYDPARHGPVRVVGPGFHRRVWACVRKVPRGCVTTYGDIARALGAATAARHVGYALAALPPSAGDVPWHRVVDHRGRIAARGEGGGASDEQARLLRREGVEVDGGGRVRDFAARRHAPPRPRDRG